MPAALGTVTFMPPMPSSNSGVSWPQFPFAAPFPPFLAGLWAASPTYGPSSPYYPPRFCKFTRPAWFCKFAGQEMEGDEDVIHLLDEEEEMEFLTFDPTVVTNSSWDAGEVINAFLEKHFSREVTVEEREGIMKDFPKPTHQFLTAPKLDEEMKKQIKKARKDPHYGSERYLYKLQEQLLDMSRSLTCS